MNCGGGKVRLEVGQSSDFGVSEDGAIYALQHLSVAGKEKEKEVVVVVYAQDLQSKQMWKTRVHLLLRPGGNRAGPEQVKD